MEKNNASLENSVMKSCMVLGARVIIIMVLAIMGSIVGAMDELNQKCVYGNDYFNRTVVFGETGRRLDNYLSKLVPFGFSGAVLVSIDGKIILNKGYGMADKEKGIPNTPSTIFSIGSLTKQFTSAAIMKLQMMGKLDVNDSIGKYLNNVPEDKKGIRIHHLLTHTAGIISGMGGGYAPNRDDEVSYILSQPLLFKEGMDFQYSNEGYTLLAAIIERVSGMEYEEFLKEFIFHPAGMYLTGYRNDRWQSYNIAINYSNGTRNGSFVDINLREYPNWKLIGNGGICSTTGDMYRWYLVLLGNEFFSEDIKKKMFTPYNNNYGYGWEVLKRADVGLVIQHDGGSTFGNAAEMRMYIDKKAVSIAFANNDGPKILLNQVRDKIEAIILGREVNMPPAVISYDSEIYKKYVGKYIYQGNMEAGFLIKNEGNCLKIKPYGQDVLNILYGYSSLESKINTQLNKSVDIILRGVVEKDFSNIGLIIKDEGKYIQFKEALSRLVERNMLQGGNIEVIGTIQYSKDGMKATIGKISRGDRYIRIAFLWDENNLVGLEVLEPDYDLEYIFLPMTNIKYVSYDIKLEKLFVLFFGEDIKKRVIGAQLNNKAFKKID